MADDAYTLEIAKTLYDYIVQDIADGDRASQSVSRIQVTLNELLDAKALSSNPAKVSGYTAQPDAKVALVNEFKADEERLLRKLDALADSWSHAGVEENIDAIKRGFMKIGGPTYDQALISEARKTLMVGFMLLNRAVFQPQRIKLPEDGE